MKGNIYIKFEKIQFNCRNDRILDENNFDERHSTFLIATSITNN